MDPDMVRDLQGKQGNLYRLKSDEARLNLFPNLPEDAIVIDDITGFAKGKEHDIGSILLEKLRDLIWIKIKESIFWFYWVFIKTFSKRESKEFSKPLYSNSE